MSSSSTPNSRTRPRPATGSGPLTCFGGSRDAIGSPSSPVRAIRTKPGTRSAISASWASGPSWSPSRSHPSPDPRSTPGWPQTCCRPGRTRSRRIRAWHWRPPSQSFAGRQSGRSLAGRIDALYRGIQRPADARKLVIAHNVESQIWQRYYETEPNALKRRYIGQQWRKFERYERHAFAAATRVVAVSAEDGRLDPRAGRAPCGRGGQWP